MDEAFWAGFTDEWEKLAAEVEQKKPGLLKKLLLSTALIGGGALGGQHPAVQPKIQETTRAITSATGKGLRGAGEFLTGLAQKVSPNK